MGWCRKFYLFLISIIVAVLYKSYYDISKPLEGPKLDMNQYWGPGDKKLYKEDTSIRKFEISYGNDVIEKLRGRLNDPPGFHLPLEGTNFEYGFNSNKLQEIIKYWRTTYLDKWTERQKFFNQFPHFKTQIQGLDIHFIHVKPKVDEDTTLLPIILLHGWPGSVREFYDILPKLTKTIEIKKMKFAFEVVVPSLPGYGWSQASSKTGMNPPHIAIIMNHLMKRLGHSQYYVQGGDWGSFIGSVMATLFPQNILGLHLNMCAINTPMGLIKTIAASFYPKLFIDEKYVDYYYPVLPTLVDVILVEMGYMHIQATKPDTIGVVLADTPTGLAAYIIEKFSTWTNKAYRSLPDGGLDKYFTLDSLLDNVMVYYLTNSIQTSQRLYAEAFTKLMVHNFDRVQTSVPTACAKFRHELMQHPDFVLRDKYLALVQNNHFEEGGHFAAMQFPDVLYDDIVEFVQKTL